MKFKIGDRVRIINRRSGNYGVECNVISNLIFAMVQDHMDGGIFYRDWIYTVDILDRNGNPCGYKPQDLGPIYDGDQKSTWEDCVWKPRELVT